jgi:hypothetical protein
MVRNRTGSSSFGPDFGSKPAANTAPPASAGKLSVEAANADLKTARTANLEKRYADAEALMQRNTVMRSDMPYL